MKRAFFVFWSLLCAVYLYCASPTFKKAEDLYNYNKPAEARPLLEAVIAEDPSNELAYLHLGIVYQQLGDLNKSIAAYRRGLNIASQYRELFLKGMGNCFFNQKQFTFAQQSYSDAITANPQFADAYLNRANARMQLQKYDGAVEDYTVFLQLRPEDSQRPKIEEIIRLLSKIRDANLARQKEEEARQKALMNDVMSSLNNASEDAKNLSVESLQFKHDTEDVDIKD
jgi:tetratricopeptide (TPR) repeat protein